MPTFVPYDKIDLLPIKVRFYEAVHLDMIYR